MMGNEMLEKEIRKVFFKQVEDFELSDSTRKLKRNIEETLTYDYKVPIRVDDFLYEIETLRKKIINKYIENLKEYLESMLYKIRLIGVSDIQSKERLIKQLLEEDFKYDASMQIEDFMDDSLRTFRRLSELREFEYLYIDVRRNFLKYIEEVNDEIFQNNRQLSIAIKDIVYSFKPIELEKSEKPYFWEMLGVNYDENVGKFWIYEENGVDKRELTQDKSKNDTYIIEDNTYFVMNKQPKNFVIAIFKNAEIIKGASVNEEEVYFEMNNNSVTYNFKDKKIVIKKNKEEITFDLNDMDLEKTEQLKQMLEEISPDVKSYFQRINVVPTYSAMFK